MKPPTTCRLTFVLGRPDTDSLPPWDRDKIRLADAELNVWIDPPPGRAEWIVEADEIQGRGGTFLAAVLDWLARKYA